MEAEKIAEKLARTLPDAGNDAKEIERLFNLKTMLRRDLYASEIGYGEKHMTERAAIRHTFADIVFAEWLPLWPPEMVKYAMECSEYPKSSYEMDLLRIGKGEMLLAHEALMRSRLLSSLKHAERSLRCHRESDEEVISRVSSPPLKLTVIACFALTKLLSIQSAADIERSTLR